VLTTDQKGAIAELAIAKAAIELDIEVYRPMAEGGRYDLIFDVRGRLFRVQCKWASRHNDVLVVYCSRTRRNADGLVKRQYFPTEIDAFAAYCADLDQCYFLPIERFPYRRQIQLRLGPTATISACSLIGLRTLSSALQFRTLGP
jgi:PD-(D/E)XK nuclease superfamily protein